MARSPVADLSSAYFPAEISTSFELPPTTPSRGLLDHTLHIPGHDMSDASFQIPIAANSSNLMTDDDFLHGNPDICATPYAPPLTLSELTPNAKRSSAELLEDANTPTSTPRPARHATPKFKPRPTPSKINPSPAALVPVHNSPSRPRVSTLKQGGVPPMVVHPRAKSAAPTTGSSKAKKPTSRSGGVSKKPVSESKTLSRIPEAKPSATGDKATSALPGRGAAATLLSYGQSMMNSAEVVQGASHEPSADAGSSSTQPHPTLTADPLTLSQLSPLKETYEDTAPVPHVGRWAPDDSGATDPDASLALAPPSTGVSAPRSPSPMRASLKRPISPELPEDTGRPTAAVASGPSRNGARGHKKGRTAPVADAKLAQPPRTRAAARREAAPRPYGHPVTRAARTKPRPQDSMQVEKAPAQKNASGDEALEHRDRSGSGDEDLMDVDSGHGSGSHSAFASGSGSALGSSGTQSGEKQGQLEEKGSRGAGAAPAAMQLKSSDKPRVGIRARPLAQAESTQKQPQEQDHGANTVFVFQGSTSSLPVDQPGLARAGSAKTTVPIEFNFSLDARMSSRRAELQDSRSSAESSTSGPAPRPVPDFAALHAAHAASLAAHKAAAVHPVVPEAFEMRLESRAREREAFEEARRQRELEAQRAAEERRKEREEEEEREYLEARRRAVPKANVVPDWYRDAPKRKRE